ncbi:MAG: Holliday junction branch migration protein RuvA [Nitrospiraceae bacterium]|nr:MAG: Holliday junction branch migration protein RuvA [Nitrospiraceae bacterium]
MIASIKGIVLSKQPEGVIVDVNGIGYHVSIPLCSLADIPESGSTVFLHTYTHVREDSLQLFGFLSNEEKKIFTSLIGINGIGPKLGLAILSGMPVQKLVEAISSENVSLLSTIPGLGKKTSARLVLELKGKLPSFNMDETISSRLGAHADDAISALVNFGYKKPLAEKAVEQSVKNGTTAIEDIIREALKYLNERH